MQATIAAASTPSSTVETALKKTKKNASATPQINSVVARLAQGGNALRWSPACDMPTARGSSSNCSSAIPPSIPADGIWGNV